MYSLAILPNLRDEPPQSLQKQEFSSFPLEILLPKSGTSVGPTILYQNSVINYTSLKIKEYDVNENHLNKYTVPQCCMQKHISRTIHLGYYQKQAIRLTWFLPFGPIP